MCPRRTHRHSTSGPQDRLGPQGWRRTPCSPHTRGSATRCSRTVRRRSISCTRGRCHQPQSCRRPCWTHTPAPDVDSHSPSAQQILPGWEHTPCHWAAAGDRAVHAELPRGVLATPVGAALLVFRADSRHGVGAGRGAVHAELPRGVLAQPVSAALLVRGAKAGRDAVTRRGVVHADLTGSRLAQGVSAALTIVGAESRDGGTAGERVVQAQLPRRVLADPVGAALLVVRADAAGDRCRRSGYCPRTAGPQCLRTFRHRNTSRRRHSCLRRSRCSWPIRKCTPEKQTALPLHHFG